MARIVSQPMKPPGVAYRIEKQKDNLVATDSDRSK